MLNAAYAADVAAGQLSAAKQRRVKAMEGAIDEPQMTTFRKDERAWSRGFLGLLRSSRNEAVNIGGQGFDRS